MSTGLYTAVRMPFERHPDARPDLEVEVGTLPELTAFKADGFNGTWIYGIVAEQHPERGKSRVLLEYAGRGVTETEWLTSIRVEVVGKAKREPVHILPAPREEKELPIRPMSSKETLTGQLGFTFFDSVAAHAAHNTVITDDWHFAENSNSSSSVIPRGSRWYVRLESRDIFDEKFYFNWIKEMQEFMAPRGGLLTFFSLIMTRDPSAEPEEAEVFSNEEDMERED